MRSRYFSRMRKHYTFMLTILAKPTSLIIWGPYGLSTNWNFTVFPTFSLASSN